MTKISSLAAIEVVLVLMAAMMAPANADIGRLFFTPSERAVFERARQAREEGPEHETIEREPEATFEIIELAPQELKPTITIDGYVKRSHGAPTLWVNGENNYDGDLSTSWVDPRTARLNNGAIRLTPIDGDTPNMYAARKQQGIILLTLMLVIMAAGSFILLKALNVAAGNSSYGKSITRSALQEAKLALIGYAVNDPAANLGPGRLPCPDLSGDGAAVGSCSLGGANPTTGWFPYATIGNGRITDATGAGLWYSVAESHRYFLTAPINSDTGDATNVLSVDGEDDIVAVIMAPGPSLIGQDRSSGAAIADFLELENSTLGDAEFTGLCHNSPACNDALITITRGELMAVVETRVLREVKRRLDDYHDEYGGYPRTSPYSDPVVKGTFTDLVGDTLGHLPIHQNGEVFNAAFTLDWNISDGVVSSGTEPNELCVRDMECFDPDPDINHDFTGIGSLLPTGTCTWTNAETFNCTATATVSVFGGATLKRTYTIVLNGVSVNDIGPTAGAGRFREFVLAGQLPSGSNAIITVSDILDGIPRGSRTLTLTDADTVDIALQNVPFLLGDDRDVITNPINSPAALPRWFTANLWHHHIYYAYSPIDAPAGAGPPCTPGISCLTVEVTRNGASVPNDNVRGVVVAAGRQLTGLPRGSLMADYFELENDQTATPIDVFSMNPPSATFSDRVVILDPDS